MENLINRPAVRNLAIALLALLVAFTAVKTVTSLKSMRYIGSGMSGMNAITVSGTGEVIATPDIATFTFTVSEEAATVPAAQKKSTDKMNAILAYVKKANIADSDVKTLSYNIYPRYEYTGTGAYYGSGKQVLAAYVVSQTIQIKVRDLDKAGEILSGIGEYGATDVSGLSFSIDKQKDVERQAREKAITDAREQANVLAKSLGVRLVRIISFSESGYPQPVYFAKAMDMSYGMGGVAMNQSAPSLPSGENKVTSNVTISYEIR